MRKEMATTFLTGHAPAAPPEMAPIVAQARLSIADGLRLMRIPSSEAGVIAYHRALEDAPPTPAILLDELSALREGRSTRFELLAQIATSRRALERGVRGPGLLLLRLVRRGFIASGAAARVRSRRALTAQTQGGGGSVAIAPVTPIEIARKLVILEGAFLRLENRMFASAMAENVDGSFSSLDDRIAALETEMKALLLDRRNEVTQR